MNRSISNRQGVGLAVCGRSKSFNMAAAVHLQKPCLLVQLHADMPATGQPMSCKLS